MVYCVLNLHENTLSLNVPITTVADDSLKYFFIIFQRKIRLDISCELSAKQTVHMTCQVLVWLKKTTKKRIILSYATIKG